MIDDTLPKETKERERKRGEKRKISEMGTRDMFEFEIESKRI